MTPLELVAGLARAIRAVVAPRLGTGREVVGTTDSGDATFALDILAEEATTAFLAQAGVPVALFSEDGGLVGDTDAPWLLVVDPIDGTRPAKAGLSTCCVSVALADNVPGATMAHVRCGAVYELGADRLFLAERGQGTRYYEGGRELRPTPGTRTELAGSILCVETAGRPLVPVAQVVGDLFDDCSLKGGAFMFASSSYALTRLVTGQFELYVDVADRVWREHPQLDSVFRRAGQGHLVTLFAYDIAASVLLAEEAGVVVTDAYGRSLDDLPLTDVSLAGHRSCLAAANPELHRRLLATIEVGLARLAQGGQS